VDRPTECSAKMVLSKLTSRQAADLLNGASPIGIQLVVSKELARAAAVHFATAPGD